MNSKPHRTNSDFQLKYFLAGSCSTADGAWTLMYGQKIDMEGKIRYAKIAELRRTAKYSAAIEVLKAPSTTEAARLNAEADIQEIENEKITSEMNLKAAMDELDCIIKLMVELEPHRKYSHLSLFEANEACQREEWLGELKSRIENYIMCQGSIPHDQLNTMRCHPDFETVLVPYIKDINFKIQTNKDSLSMLKQNSIALLGG
jgi:hypothetical protein